MKIEDEDDRKPWIAALILIGAFFSVRRMAKRM
jgi:hypothetical protein